MCRDHRPVATVLHAIDVVPAVGRERVGNHRRAEQEPHLAAAHADLDLADVLHREQVALLDVGPVHAPAEKRGCREQRREQVAEFRHAYFRGVRCLELPALAGHNGRASYYEPRRWRGRWGTRRKWNLHSYAVPA